MQIRWTYLFWQILVSRCVIFKCSLHDELLIELDKAIADWLCFSVNLLCPSDPQYIERQVVVCILQVQASDVQLEIKLLQLDPWC